ncbi:unnamed protein product, partial [Vitis vinifera]|uniref:Uncharacterized protein n=1 Tax=Vitis vinifera TaxID=29760 RepID=D7TXU1_VITVI
MMHWQMTTMKSANSIGSPPISEKFKALHCSLRKALLPVNSNDSRKPLEDLSSKGRVCPVPFEPKTPKHQLT